MAERVVLHVGLMKSGTSFVQQVLRHNREALAERGMLFPSPWRRQVRAVRDVIDGPDSGGAWSEIVEEVRAWSGTAVLSMEFLGPRGPRKAREIVDAFAPADVEVVVSVRDLARTIPAMWQESLQNRGTWTWSDYLAGVAAEDRDNPGPGRAFWKRQDAPGIVESWQQAVGREGVTVLTVPPAGAPPGLLWERFAGRIGLSGSEPDIDLAVSSNPSLGLASLLVLRELNLRLGDTLSPRAYERVVKQGLAKRGLAGLRDDPRLGYDADWVAARGQRDVARLRALAPRVAGDLDDLECHPVTGADPAEIELAQQLDAAVAGLLHAVTALARRT